MHIIHINKYKKKCFLIRVLKLFWRGNQAPYLCPRGTCFPHVTESISGLDMIWRRTSSSSLKLPTKFAFGVLENSILSLITVIIELSGTVRFFPLERNSAGGFDLKVESEMRTISDELFCILKLWWQLYCGIKAIQHIAEWLQQIVYVSLLKY